MTRLNDRPTVPPLNAYGTVDVRSGAPDGWCAVRVLPAPMDMMFALRLPVLRALVGFDRTYHGYSPDVSHLVPECSWRVLASAEGRRAHARLGLEWDGDGFARENKRREQERKARERANDESKKAAQKVERSRARRKSLAVRKAQAARVAELLGATCWKLTGWSGRVLDHVRLDLHSGGSHVVKLGRPDEALVRAVQHMEDSRLASLARRAEEEACKALETRARLERERELCNELGAQTGRTNAGNPRWSHGTRQVVFSRSTGNLHLYESGRETEAPEDLAAWLYGRSSVLDSLLSEVPT